MRRIVVFVSALCAFAVASAPALAGGWAVTTVVEMPTAFVPGASHEVAFQIRQHGTTLVTSLDGVAVRLHRVDGSDALHFPAKIDGTTWRATVVTPDDGDWTWTIRPGLFEAVEMGRLPLADGTQRAASPPDLMPISLGLGLAAMGGLILLRHPRRVAAAAN